MASENAASSSAGTIPACRSACSARTAQVRLVNHVVDADEVTRYELLAGVAA